MIGQRLKRQPVVGRCQGAGNGVRRTGSLLGRQEDVDGFLEAALEQVLVTAEGDRGGGGGVRRESDRQVEAVDGVKEKQGPHPGIKVIAGAAEGVQGGGLRE